MKAPATAVITLSVLLVSLAGVSAAETQKADLEQGKKLFNACKGCHEIGTGARNKVGPHLDGVFGRTAGSIKGFKYSSAMKDAGKNGLIWDEKNLGEYLEKPRDFITGNRMSFRGMVKPQDRVNLLAWLASISKTAPANDPNTAQKNPIPGFTAAVLKLDGDREYGEYLSGECVTCHQVSGHADGIPSIVGIPKEYFITSLFEYKSNIRSNDVMKLRVENLTNEEVAALAAYFSSLDPK